MTFKGKLIQNPNAGILQQCFFSDHNNKKESQMGFKAQNTVLNLKRRCAGWADQTLDSNFKRRPRGVSQQKKSFEPIKLLLCFWHHQRWKLMAKLVDKSFHVQKGFTSFWRGDDVHSHATSCLHCNWDPCSPWSVPMPTTTIPYCLLVIWITVMTSTASYQFPYLCTALSQASRPIPAAAVPGFELKVPLCPSPRTGLPNTSWPMYACEIRNLSRLHKFWKGMRLLCPWPTSVAWEPLTYPHHPRWNHSLG